MPLYCQAQPNCVENHENAWLDNQVGRNTINAIDSFRDAELTDETLQLLMNALLADDWSSDTLEPHKRIKGDLCVTNVILLCGDRI